MIDGNHQIKRVVFLNKLAPAHEVGPARLLLQNFRAGQTAYLAQRDGLAAGQCENARVVLLLELAIDVHRDHVGVLRARIVALDRSGTAARRIRIPHPQQIIQMMHVYEAVINLPVKRR